MHHHNRAELPMVSGAVLLCGILVVSTGRAQPVAATPTASFADVPATAAPEPGAPKAVAPAMPTAGATTPPATGDAVEQAGTGMRPVSLHVDVKDSALDAETIATALREKLGIPFTLTTGTGPADLHLTIVGRALRARAIGDLGGLVLREMTLPEDPAQELEMIALLSDNLLRDEAGKILSRFAAEPIEPNDMDPVAPQKPGTEQAPASPSSPTPTAKPIPPPPPRPELPYFAASVALVRGVSFPWHADKLLTSFGLGLPDARFGELRGLGIGGVGLSLSGPSYGLMVGGIAATSSDFMGLSIGGAYHESKDVYGLSIGGLYEESHDFTGLSIGGLYNKVGHELRGFQIGGGYSAVEGRSYGVQIGIVNHARGPMNGVQIGLVNIKRQGGTGAQLGLIGIEPETAMQLVTWVSGWGTGSYQRGFPVGPTANVGVRIRGRHVTSMLHMSGGSDGTACATCKIYLGGYTLGGRWPLGRYFSVEADFQHRSVVGSQLGGSKPHLFAIRVSAVVSPSPWFSIFASGGPELGIDGIPTYSTWIQESLSLGLQLSPMPPGE